MFQLGIFFRCANTYVMITYLFFKSTNTLEFFRKKIFFSNYFRKNIQFVAYAFFLRNVFIEVTHILKIKAHSA